MLTIDRSHPSRTVKHHYVQEYDPDGRAAGEPHEHTEISPAKRRPRTAKRLKNLKTEQVIECQGSRDVVDRRVTVLERDGWKRLTP